MKEEILKNILINQEVKYYDINNIFFDDGINKEQFEELKQILLSYNNISQIYFRNNTDLNTIETVNNLLKLSTTTNNSLVEKYILNTDNIDLKKLLDIDFYDENTWYVSIEDENMRKKIYKLEDYRILNNSLEKILNKMKINEYSQIEQVGIIYDYCKKLTINEQQKENLINAINKKNVTKKQLVLIFQLLLRKIGIDSYIGKTLNDNEQSNALIISINDLKYNINGIYLFDVLSDYLGYKDVPNKDLRIINYNYFGIKIGDYSKTIFNDKLSGLINYLTHDLEYDLEKISFISKEEIQYLELCLGDTFVNLHKKISESKEIPDDDKFKIINVINNLNNSELIKENYLSRKDKILNYGIINF